MTHSNRVSMTFLAQHGGVRKHLQQFLVPSFEIGLLPPKHGEVMKGFLYTGIYYMSRDLMRIKLEWLSKAGGKLLEFPNS